MAETSTVAELRRLVRSLKAERSQHEAAIATIDQTFSELGIDAEAVFTSVERKSQSHKRVGRPKKKVGRPRKKVTVAKPAAQKRGGKRRKFAMSGDDAVLAFIKANPGCTSAQINAYWKKQGRAGKADNSMSKLTREGKVTRTNIKGARGSQYRVKA